MKKILFHILSALAGLALVYFLGREFIQNWAHIRTYTFHFNPPLLMAASLAYIISFGILSFGWHLILRFLRHPMPLFETILAFIITQPGKYIPGKIWVGVARMKFCSKHNIPRSIAFLSTGIEAFLEIIVGSYISLFALLQTEALRKYSMGGMILLGAIGLIFLIPQIFFFGSNVVLKIAGRPPLERHERVNFPRLLLLQTTYLVAMGLLGVAQVLFLESFTPVSREYFFLLMSIGAFTYVVSILAFFAPGGLGVREGVWYLVLENIVAPHVAFIYAFISRLWMIIMEALMLFFALPAWWYWRRRAK